MLSNNNTIIIKLYMSSRDLVEFTNFVQNYDGDFTIFNRREQLLNELLNDKTFDNSFDKYEVSFNSFSRIDNFPLLDIKSSIDIKSLQNILGMIGVSNFKFQDLGDLEAVQLVAISDTQAYRQTYG